MSLKSYVYAVMDDSGAIESVIALTPAQFFVFVDCLPEGWFLERLDS